MAEERYEESEKSDSRSSFLLPNAEKKKTKHVQMSFNFYKHDLQ